MAEVALKPTFYRGASMHPTLKAPDTLQVVPYQRRKIQRGDVIVFFPPGRGHRVIHRIVSVSVKGIRTRGDNNTDIDPWNLSPESIVGRVVSAHRGKRKRRVFGGPVGHALAVTRRALRTMDSRVSSLIRPIYYWLNQAGIFRRMYPARMKMRVVSYNRPLGTELQLLMGRRLIGRLLPGRKQWVIRRPFRLFVDEESLPENKEEISGFRFQVAGKNEDI